MCMLVVNMFDGRWRGRWRNWYVLCEKRHVWSIGNDQSTVAIGLTRTPIDNEMNGSKNECSEQKYIGVELHATQCTTRWRRPAQGPCLIECFRRARLSVTNDSKRSDLSQEPRQQGRQEGNND